MFYPPTPQVKLSDSVCVCCEMPKQGSSCSQGETLRLTPLRDCNTIRLRLKVGVRFMRALMKLQPKNVFHRLIGDSKWSPKGVCISVLQPWTIDTN